jgi:site-specific DNA recombinase
VGRLSFPLPLHPATLERCQQQIAGLQSAMASSHAHDATLGNALRDLIETVTVRSDPENHGGFIVEIAGRLAALTQRQAFPDGIHRVWGTLVAGEGFEPPTYGL